MDTNGNQLSDNDNSTINHRNKHKAEGRTQLNNQQQRNKLNAAAGRGLSPRVSTGNKFGGLTLQQRGYTKKEHNN